MNVTTNAEMLPAQREVEPSDVSQFWRGFLALMPLWTGAIPVGVAYAVAARDAGLSPLQTQLMSLTVFSAAAQFSAVSLFSHGTPVVVMIVTAMTLNLQLFLFGLTAARDSRPSLRRRFLTAYFLTDGAFAIAVGNGRIRMPVLLGAGVSMFTAWNVGTLIGAAAGAILPDLSRVGVDFVAPLTFLAVLVPLLRSKPAILTLVVAAATTLILTRFMPTGAAVLGAGLTGSVAGSWSAGYLERHAPRHATSPVEGVDQ
ncbi:MAG: AzlC family ABC transporter permease [Nitrolancea sp.]